MLAATFSLAVVALFVGASRSVASNHLSPAPHEAGLQWLGNAPLAELDTAAANSEFVLVAKSAGEAAKVRRVGFGAFESVDLDADGDVDLRAMLELDTSTTPPTVDLVTTRGTEDALTVGPPTDVEVLTFVPWDDQTDESTTERPNLVVGYRTTSPDGTAGGTLPEEVVQTFHLDQVTGRDHEITVGFELTAPSQHTGQPRLLGGHFDGTDASGVVNADLLSILPEDKLERIDEISLSVDASQLGTDPVHGTATAEWTASAETPVEIDYLESESAPSGTPEVNTVVDVDPMPTSETLEFTLDEDHASTPLKLTHTANTTVDSVEVRHTRADGGTMLAFGLQDLPPNDPTTVAVTTDSTVDVTLPSGETADVYVEAEYADIDPDPDGRDGRSIVGHGSFSRELDHLYAEIADAATLTLTPTYDGTAGIELDVSNDGYYGPEATFVASHDIEAPTVPSSWNVSGHPSTWGGAIRGEIAVIDDQAGSTIGARIESVSGLSVGLDPATMADNTTLSTDQEVFIDALLRLDAGVPLAPASQPLEVRCDATLPEGDGHTFSVEPPDTFSWTLDGEMRSIDCTGNRGQIGPDQRAPVGFELEADGIPGRSSAAIDFDSQARGSLSVQARPADPDEPRVGDDIDDLSLQVWDEESGLTGPALLGNPAHFAVFDASGLPSTEVQWSGADDPDASGATSVDIVAPDADSTESTIDALRFRLRTDIPQEILQGTPDPGGLSGHYLEAIEAGNANWIGAGVRGAKEIHLDVTDADSQVSATGRFRGAFPLAVSLTTTDGGPFTTGWRLDGFDCGLGDLPAADDVTVELTPPDTVLLDTTGSGFGEIFDCEGRIVRPADDLDAHVELDGGGLPPHLQLDVTPGNRVSLDTGTGEVGFIEAQIEDASSSGLPGSTGLFEEPMAAASVRLDDAASHTVFWTSDGGTELTATPDQPDGKVGTVQVDVRTDGQAADLRDVTTTDPHRFEIHEETGDGSAYAAHLTTRLVGIGASSIDLSDRLDVELGTVTDRTLEADIETASGGAVLPNHDIDATIELDDVPGTLVYRSDLAGYHDLDGSDGFDELRFDGTVDDVHANGKITQLPSDLTVDAELPSVTASGPTGAVDVKATNTASPAGLFDGVNELRITAEGLPGNLSVDLDGLAASTTVEQGSDGAVEVMDGTASITEGEGSSGPIGRLAVTVSSTNGDGFFGTPYTYAKVDLEGVPTTWTVSYRHDADSGDADVEVQPGSGSLSSASVQVTRKEGGAKALSDALAAFEDTAVGMDRSDYTAEIDRRHFPTSIEQRLDDLFSDAAAFATTTRTAPSDPWPQQSSSSAPAPLTVPDQDHAIILGELFDPTVISARISDVSTATISSSGKRGASGTIERSGGGPVPLFVGYRHTARTSYDFPELRSVPDRQPGHPKAENNASPGKFYEVTETGPKHFTVLGNDEPASDTDGDQLDESTLRIVDGPDHGTVTLADPVDGHPRRHIAYEPEDGHDGTDQVTYEICDHDGDCSRAVVLITTREEYREAIIARIADSPAELTFNVERTQVEEDGDKYWETREFDYTADRTLGRVDLHVGPFEPLQVADPQRVHGILYDGPAEVSADLHGTAGLLRLTEDGSWLFPDGGSGLFGAEINNFDIDTSQVSDLVFATEDRTQRVVAGVQGEDLSIDTPLEGSFAGDTFALEGVGCAPFCKFINKGQHPHALPNVDGTNGCHFAHFGAVCAQLLHTAFDLDAEGDTTGKPARGFAALYERRDDPDRLSPSGPAPGAQEWVPSATGEFQGVEHVDVGVEIRLLLGARFPLGIKPVGRLGFNSFPIATGDLWWNSDGRVCSPVPPFYRSQVSSTLGEDDTFRWGSDLLVELQGNELCFEFGTPDYVDNTPTISFDPAPSGFDPYSGQPPQSVDRLASGTATAGSPFFSPMLRFYVIPLDTELGPFGSLGLGRFAAAAATGTVELTEVPPDQVEAPFSGDPLAAVRIDGRDETIADGVLVGFDLTQLAPDGRPVCAANELPDGSVGSVRCIDVSHERGRDMGIGGRLELVIDRPGTVVLVDQSDLDATSLRVAGPTRIHTAVQAARAGWSSAETVLLATSRNYPDALAAAPLAGVLDAPILLTPPEQLPGEVRETIAQLNTGRVVIVGGTAAISADVADELDAAGLDVDRIGGVDRHDTARKVAAEVTDAGQPVDPTVAFLASSQTFADALAAAPIAAEREQPLYLTRPETISATTLDAMDDEGITRVRIVGGPAAISLEVEELLANAGISVLDRYAGADRYETARDLADWGAASGADLGEVLIATGGRFPDSLTAGALGGRLDRVLLLADPTAGSDQPAGDFLAEHASSIDRLMVVGGEGAVPVTTVRGLVGSAVRAP